MNANARESIRPTAIHSYQVQLERLDLVTTDPAVGRNSYCDSVLLRPTSLANPSRIARFPRVLGHFDSRYYLGRQMSNQDTHPHRINRDHRRYMPDNQEGETIATFGEARMMRGLGGRIEIVGGTEEDRSEAREWVSRFLLRGDPSGGYRSSCDSDP